MCRSGSRHWQWLRVHPGSGVLDADALGDGERVGLGVALAVGLGAVGAVGVALAVGVLMAGVGAVAGAVPRGAVTPELPVPGPPVASACGAGAGRLIVGRAVAEGSPRSSPRPALAVVRSPSVALAAPVAAGSWWVTIVVSSRAPAKAPPTRASDAAA